MLSLMTYMKTSRSLVNIARSNYTAHSRLHKIERIERERQRERDRERDRDRERQREEKQSLKSFSEQKIRPWSLPFEL